MVELLIDLGLGLLDLQAGEEVCGRLERISYRVLESCFVIPLHTYSFVTAAKSPKICSIVHQCLLDELGLLFC